MATQYDPIAKDESLNTTESPSRNIADVLAEELARIVTALGGGSLEDLNDVTITTPSNGQTLVYNSTTQKWENANGGGGGGHTIIDPDDTSMTQRAGLAFIDAHVSDDAVNDETEIEIVEAISKTDWDNLDATDPSNNGLYEIEDPNNTPVLDASMVAYGNGTVDDALDYAIDAQLNKAVVFSTIAVGGKYFAVLGRLPIEYPSMPTLLRVNVLGSGDAPLTDFTVAALDTSDYYISTTNSNYGGKAIFVSMSI